MKGTMDVTTESSTHRRPSRLFRLTSLTLRRLAYLSQRHWVGVVSIAMLLAAMALSASAHPTATPLNAGPVLPMASPMITENIVWPEPGTLGVVCLAMGLLVLRKVRHLPL
jgi:hypothetical protein